MKDFQITIATSPMSPDLKVQILNLAPDDILPEQHTNKKSLKSRQVFANNSFYKTNNQRMTALFANTQRAGLMSNNFEHYQFKGA